METIKYLDKKIPGEKNAVCILNAKNVEFGRSQEEIVGGAALI